MTIREALRTAAERLELHRVSNARMTAEVLLAHLLSVTREYLHTHDDRVLTPEDNEALETAIYDRVSGVPLQYIVGKQEFYGRYFHVNPSVLIPRPETEFIIETVLGIYATWGQTPRCRILDVGTGSGCIGVTLSLEIPRAEVFAGDISEEAVRVARRNASVLNANVSFFCTDLMDGIGGQFDFIVSNPPYVAPGELNRLQREVRDHEPHVALFGGLEIYNRLIQGAGTHLHAEGYLVAEIGLGMEEPVLNLFGREWEKLPTKTDLQGIPRTIIAKYSRGTSQSSGEGPLRN
jgi:release factor glutamine methyltransferase